MWLKLKCLQSLDLLAQPLTHCNLLNVIYLSKKQKVNNGRKSILSRKCKSCVQCEVCQKGEELNRKRSQQYRAVRVCA